MSLAPHVPLEWIGFGCVLVAIPVLIAADALADVFQKRNGPLARPLPWSIILPIFTGLSMTVTGIALTAIRFPDVVALVPAAALAAVMMAVTARRSGHVGFVWAMLVGLLLAYQSSPVFFRELAKTIVHHGAAAVREDRLPIAFYGLTYLPLLAGIAATAVWHRRRGDGVFSRPMTQFTVGLSTLLLFASLTHIKAMFPVGLVLAVGFTAQTFLFRDRRLLLTALAA